MRSVAAAAAASAVPPPLRWKNVFHQIMTGIYFLQLMLMCVLLVKKFPYALLVLPLLVFTVVFHIVNNSEFSRPWRLGNARESAMLDARDHVSRVKFFYFWEGGGALLGAQQQCVLCVCVCVWRGGGQQQFWFHCV